MDLDSSQTKAELIEQATALETQDGGSPEPPPDGGVSSVEALAPLVSATAGNGVVVIALDLRLLSPMPL